MKKYQQIGICNKKDCAASTAVSVAADDGAMAYVRGCMAYQATLNPTHTLALELSGMNSLLVLPSRWSMPMKKF